MDALVAEGIDLAHSYVFYCCSPTRSSLQSGRNPVHVNVLNAAPDVWEPANPAAGAAGMAREMTGMGIKMAAANYSTHFFGKCASRQQRQRWVELMSACCAQGTSAWRRSTTVSPPAPHTPPLFPIPCPPLSS